MATSKQTLAGHTADTRSDTQCQRGNHYNHHNNHCHNHFIIIVIITVLITVIITVIIIFISIAIIIVIIIMIVRFIIKIPDGFPLESAGPVFCAGITMFSPLTNWGAIKVCCFLSWKLNKRIEFRKDMTLMFPCRHVFCTFLQLIYYLSKLSKQRAEHQSINFVLSGRDEGGCCWYRRPGTDGSSAGQGHG